MAEAGELYSQSFSPAGYLLEDHHFFHLRDTAGQERDFHFHTFDKIVILLSGRVDYTIEGETYAMQPGDVLLVAHHAIHRAEIDRDQPYDRVIIYMDNAFPGKLMPDAGLTACFTPDSRSGPRLLTPSPAERETLDRLLKAWEDAVGDTQYGAKVLQDTLLLQLLVLFNRMYAAGHVAGQDRKPPRNDKIASTLSYINENLRRPLTPEILAERVYLSPYYFMRLFKAQTGSTVHAYIQQKRLANAARLIREGTGAGQAAALSGFSDYSVFYRAFRSRFGIVPGQLK